MSNQDVAEYQYDTVLFRNDATQNEPANIVIKGLIELGLTHNEAKVYMYLAKCGHKKAIEISKSLHIPRTETYHLLSKLQSKGLVTATLQHPIKYVAAPFDQTIQILINMNEERLKTFEKKKCTLLDTWNKLPDFVYEEGDERERFQILEGKSSVYPKIKDMCNRASKEIDVIGNERDFLRFYHYDVIDTLQAIESDVKVRTLTSMSQNSHYTLDGLDKSGIKIIESEELPCFIVKDDSEMLLFVSGDGNRKDVLALWTDCRSLINAMKLLFSQLWVGSKSQR